MTPVTLLLHSTGTMPSMWTPYHAIVAPLGVPVAPSHLGYPPYAPIARGQIVTAHDDARAVIDALPASATDVHIVAHSYGGLVALEIVRQLGPRVRSLFLFEPTLFATVLAAPDATPDARAALVAMTENPAVLHSVATGGDDNGIEFFIDFWNRPGSWQRMPEPQRQLVRALGWKLYQEVRSVFTIDVAAGLTIGRDVPVTLACGERTQPVARAVVDLMARRIPHAEVTVVNGTGHMAPLTHPALTTTVLQAHVARVRLASV